MQVILIDTETTGLDTSTERIIEIGAQVVDENWDIINSLSCLVKGDDFPPLTDDIQRITGITQEELNKRGLPVEDAWSLLEDMITPDVNYAIAFNRAFDEAIYKAEMARYAFNMVPGLNWLSQIPWLCAMADIESNYMYRSWKLSHLALEYGVTVNPKELHRAINDVELMRQMLKATGTTPTKMYEFQQIPWVFVRAVIPAPWEDGGKGKNEAQKLGYSWEVAKGTDGPKFEKAWIKRIKAHQLEAETKHAPFPVREIRS